MRTAGTIGGRMRGLATALHTPFRAKPGQACAVFGCACLRALCDLSLAWWLKMVTDAATGGRLASSVAYAIALGAAAALGLVAGAIGVRLQFPLAEATRHYVERRVVDATAGIAGIEVHETPEYLNQLELLRVEQRDLAHAGPEGSNGLALLLQITITAVLLASIRPVLLTVGVFVLPPLWASRKAEKLHARAYDLAAVDVRRSRHLFELATTTGPGKELRIFGLERELLSRHEVAWRDVDATLDRAALRGLGGVALAWSVFVVGYLGALLVTMRAAVAGDATFGDVILVITLLTQVTLQANAASNSVAVLARLTSVAGRYLWLLEYAAKAEVSGSDSPPDRVTDRIELVDVGFSYPGMQADVLTGLNLVVPAGSTVAVVGENGAGKSTLIKLLCRLYEPDGGAIYIDEGRLSDFHIEQWRKRITVGFQDFARFELLARQVVGVGDVPHVDDEDAVRGALANAGASAVADSFAHGLDTQLGSTFPGGHEVSGGQWQKLALGRTLMRPSPLLIVFDEPTANLDADAEAALFHRYATTSRAIAAHNGAVTVLVSHRFSTVRMADLIVVLDSGRIIELGTHDELLASAGLYAELFNLQARSYR
jgi:ATP-binding cassette subfamily B protein